MTDLYIYYKVRDDIADELTPRVQHMQRALAERSGVNGQLKRRLNAKNGLQTWMEVYLSTSWGFDAMLLEEVTRAGLLASINGERHTEAFRDIFPCA
jgi:hypothetical protein